MTEFKRRIFYIGGFDPRGVRFYYHLLKEQVARYAAKTGEDVVVSPRRKASTVRSDWSVRNATLEVTTDYTFLRWEDIVQHAWIKNPLQLIVRGARTYRDHIRHLDFKWARALPNGPLVTMFYPPILAVLIPLLITLPLFLIGMIWLSWWIALLGGLAIGIAAALPILGMIRVPWLMRFFIFNSELCAGEGSPALQDRLDAFADAMDAVIDGTEDEILLVSHSNGSIIAMLALDRLFERRGGVLPAQFAVLTYGHSIPLVAGRRDATIFRRRLANIATRDFHWVDVGSPPDGAAFHGVNPMVTVSADPKPRMDLLNPRFYRFYDTANYKTGFASKYEIHFDYLRVGDRVSPIDLPSITASRRPIAAAVAAFREIP
jgi:hypothetical protein